MSVVLVEWKKPAVNCIGETPAHPRVRLMPGINEVPEKAWAEVQKIKLVQVWLRDGDLLEVAKAGSKPGSSMLEKLSVPDAQAMIAKTFDRELLRRWLAPEKRVQVAGALKDQIDLCTFKPERDTAAVKQGAVATDDGKGGEL